MTSTSSLPWVDPGAFEVADGVYRVPLPLPNDGLRAVNVYVLVTGDGLVCVDAGWAIPESKALFVAALASLGHGLEDVRRFLVTHVHRDHYTQAVDIRRDVGAHVGLGLGEKPTLDRLQDPSRSPLGAQVEHLRTCGAADLAAKVGEWAGGHQADLDLWQSPDEWLQEGPVVLSGRTLHAVETPGHTAGHLVFHDTDARLLFAGDHVLPTITPSIGFEPALTANPLGDFLQSLAVVRSRPDAMLLPAHGPVTASVHARGAARAHHHGHRLAETEAAVRAGAVTPFEVAGALRWTKREHRLADLDAFNGMLAVFETGAHLHLLAAQGRLTSALVDGVRSYAA
jgi:glyoxylase-like metal-dependent hydrolase (beta-lactamase superfamily II)